MITQIAGTLLSKDLDGVEVMTSAGVGYRLSIPLSVFETLPRIGGEVTLHTHLVVKEDAWQLFGFANTYERRVFERLLAAKGVGPALALAMLSTLSADRVVRAIRERDIATLQSVPRVGRKKAEQLVLDLADKLDDLEGTPGSRAAGGDSPRGLVGAAADDAIRALVSLGYAAIEAERAVRAVLESGQASPGHEVPAPELIRTALGRMMTR